MISSYELENNAGRLSAPRRAPSTGGDGAGGASELGDALACQ